jgi:hypothetical protein
MARLAGCQAERPMDQHDILALAGEEPDAVPSS